MFITELRAREILDSRGNPTIETDLTLEQGAFGRASVPSGASTGNQEAHELRDGDATRYAGKGVKHAVEHVNNEIFQALNNKAIDSQAMLDGRLCELDGTPNKTHLGANAILSVSLAFARASAQAAGKQLIDSLMLGQLGQSASMPVPMMNVLNGGAHANNNVDIQEFMIMPVGAPDFPTALQMGTEIYHALGTVLKQSSLNTAVGDEGGFAPDLVSNQAALDMLMHAVELAGFRAGEDIVFALDVAASELHRDGRYHLASENKTLSSDEMIRYYTSLIDAYPIVSIEDGLDEEDWAGWEALTQTLSSRVQLVGDDLFATNPARLQQGINQHVANAILIKLNQIGTLSQTIEAIRLAQAHQYRCVISHRSGETEDTFIADLSVASGCGQIKTGAPCRTDRVAKYNQLLRINEMLDLPFAGRSAVISCV